MQNTSAAKGKLRLAIRILPAQVAAMRIEVEQEADGRWIAEVPDFPGALAYGLSREDAIANVEALVLRAIAD